MKVRNKKTGKVKNLSVYGDIVWIGNYRYNSLAELNEEWEDYTQKESLIKDEKIREAVKNWALTNYKNHMIIEFDNNMNGFYMFMENTNISLCGISFQPDIELGLEERDYTITELCGESES